MMEVNSLRAHGGPLLRSPLYISFFKLARAVCNSSVINLITLRRAKLWFTPEEKRPSGNPEACL